MNSILELLEKTPFYIIMNTSFLCLNIVLSNLFLWKNHKKQKNIALLELQKTISFCILIIEVLFLFSISFWTNSGMDSISWNVAPIQQIFYIVSENLKSVIFFFVLITMLIHRGQR